MYEDEKLVCEDCGKEFIFTAGEQEFYAEKGLVNKPKRCPECRSVRRKNNRKRRKMYDAVCSKCGAQNQIVMQLFKYSIVLIFSSYKYFIKLR